MGSRDAEICDINLLICAHIEALRYLILLLYVIWQMSVLT